MATEPSCLINVTDEIYERLVKDLNRKKKAFLWNKNGKKSKVVWKNGRIFEPATKGYVEKIHHRIDSPASFVAKNQTLIEWLASRDIDFSLLPDTMRNLSPTEVNLRGVVYLLSGQKI